MVGIFSRLSGSIASHRRARSTLEGREGSNLAPENVGEPVVTVGHGIEVAVEFKPVEHPMEPLDKDKPVQCPTPEPSILNDKRVWKERVSAGIRRRTDLPGAEERGPLESESSGTKAWAHQSHRILPSLSAPEHNILKLLEECNASGI